MCCSELSVRIYPHKGKKLMTKGITPSCKKHVFAFPKEATMRLWLSAINRDADYAPRTITARVRVRLNPKAVSSVFVKYLFKPFLRGKGLTDL